MVIVEDHIEPLDMQVLLAGAREGDTQKFCQLVQPLEARLLRQALALCHDQGTAEDLASETLIEAWRSLRRYDGTCRLSTWLYAILLQMNLNLAEVSWDTWI